jgi:quercetin dioxygenase-like cupin family protein
MDAVTPKSLDPADLRSHHVRVGEMEWQETRFPGCEVKTLLFDRASGLVTALMRFAPGAVLPDHEHVKVEQTYVLEGKLVDREGPDAGLSVPQGDFVWRPAGSRHSAWCPQGRARAGNLPAAQQVLRERRPRDRHRGPRLVGDLGRDRSGRPLKRYRGSTHRLPVPRRNTAMEGEWGNLLRRA